MKRSSEELYSDSFIRWHHRFEIDPKLKKKKEGDFQVTRSLMRRLGLYAELDGHTGCVNCLDWRKDVLASGSDDVHVHLWDPFRKRSLLRLNTTHQGNIFSVKFLNDKEIVSGAGDGTVRYFNVQTEYPLSICTCHGNRVKRIDIEKFGSEFLYWSGAEDGLVLQHDARESHQCAGSIDDEGDNPKNVLIDIRKELGSKAEVKCLAVHPLFHNYIAVGANDPYVRLYDRRKSTLPVKYYVPGHLPWKLLEFKKKQRSLASTYLVFNESGTELLVNLGGEQMYVFPSDSGAQTTEDFDKSVSAFLTTYKNGISQNSGGLPQLSGIALDYKNKANAYYEKGNYLLAVNLYNEALDIAPCSHVLLANRAAALLQRNWDGDVYAALKDCVSALSIDPHYSKAHLRLSHCLNEMERYDESYFSLEAYKDRFPQEANNSRRFKELREEIAIKRKKKKPSKNIFQETNAPKIDFSLRYCGHCNTTTDIKEGNFFGKDYIIGGSDDGRFFIWNKKTTNIERILKGDDSIVNCLQPHPSQFFLASSGIDSSIKTWTVKEINDESDYEEDLEVKNTEDAALANQKRMTSVANPYHLILMNLGYPTNPETSNVDESTDDVPIQCNPT